MAFFDWLKSALSKLFSLARKGLDAFLVKYGQRAKDVLIAQFRDHIENGVPLANWKSEAWMVINKTFNIDGKIPGNWIDLLVGFAYEQIMKQKGKTVDFKP